MAKGCWAIANIKKYVNKHTLRQIYFALVYPHLQYAITCWGGSAKCHLTKIIIKQKWAVKLISNCARDTPSNPLFIQLNLLKLNDVYKLKVGTEIKKMIALNLIVNTDFQFNCNLYRYSTRSSAKNNFYVPQVKTNVGKSSLKYRGAVIWNEIPIEIRSKSITTFKHHYKKYLIKLYEQET